MNAVVTQTSNRDLMYLYAQFMVKSWKSRWKRSQISLSIFPLKTHGLCNESPFVSGLLQPDGGLNHWKKKKNREWKSSHLFSVDFPAPCPAFLSTRSRSGLGLCGEVYCNVAAYLNECIGTTRSSSVEYQNLGARSQDSKTYDQLSRVLSEAIHCSSAHCAGANEGKWNQNHADLQDYRSRSSKLCLISVFRTNVIKCEAEKYL